MKKTELTKEKRTRFQPQDDLPIAVLEDYVAQMVRVYEQIDSSGARKSIDKTAMYSKMQQMQRAIKTLKSI